MVFELPSIFMRSCDDGMFYCLSLWANSVTYGWFWVLALSSFALIIYMATINTYGSLRAFGYSGFVLLMGSIWLGTMKLLSPIMTSSMIIIGIIAIAIMINSERSAFIK